MSWSEAECLLLLLTVATPPPVRSSGSFLTLTACARRAAISVMPDVAPAPATVAAAVVTMLLVEYSATEVTACSSCKWKQTGFMRTYTG